MPLLQRVPGHAAQSAHTVKVAPVTPVAPVAPPSPVALVPDPVPVSNGLSGWFSEESKVDTPVPEAWQAADAAVSQPATRVTAAGLPMRKPGSRVVPAVQAEPKGTPASSLTSFRNADAIRSNLSRHYNGVRAARERTRTLEGDRSEGAS
jgi:hypothetical protein